MAKQIIVPERGKIEVVGDNGYSRRDFLGLAGRLGAGILTASVGFGALDGLVGNEENAVYAQGKKTLLYALVGFLISMASWVIISFFVSALR